MNSNTLLTNLIQQDSQDHTETHVFVGQDDRINKFVSQYAHNSDQVSKDVSIATYYYPSDDAQPKLRYVLANPTNITDSMLGLSGGNGFCGPLSGYTNNPFDDDVDSNNGVETAYWTVIHNYAHINNHDLDMVTGSLKSSHAIDDDGNVNGNTWATRFIYLFDQKTKQIVDSKSLGAPIVLKLVNKVGESWQISSPNIINIIQNVDTGYSTNPIEKYSYGSAHGYSLAHQPGEAYATLSKGEIALTTGYLDGNPTDSCFESNAINVYKAFNDLDATPVDQKIINNDNTYLKSANEKHDQSIFSFLFDGPNQFGEIKNQQTGYSVRDTQLKKIISPRYDLFYIILIHNLYCAPTC